MDGAIQLIEQHFGEATAKVYQNLYVGMPVKVMLRSLQDLFIDYLGEAKAHELVDELCTTYHCDRTRL